MPRTPGTSRKRHACSSGLATSQQEAGDAEREAAGLSPTGEDRPGAAGLRRRRAWYRKSLAISEKQGNEHGAAITYHQLGRIAQERARLRRRRVLVPQVPRHQGEAGRRARRRAPITNGEDRQEQRDFDAAETWYRKSLAIKEKQGNEHGGEHLSPTGEDRPGAARPRRRRALVPQVPRHLGEAGQRARRASTYHQLGRIAEDREDSTPPSPGTASAGDLD